ncbi:hypothetical protein PRUB_a4777 [Pseudoalteromonas rubra]|uniref:Uncharacterized protein n=1 Tax=Pseudoalteromonas rubra TaxID=43658 RepID=A0A8T0C9F6_9GAMM|nr:hypothetical protein [Pseudoalteromonas rubra]KAF7787404.1 hypothetical protein PRUB_a4777 [Pseudoalteromonas rubra]
MKLKLNKKPIKALSKNPAFLPAEMTPEVAGGTGITTLLGCNNESEECGRTQSCVRHCFSPDGH